MVAICDHFRSKFHLKPLIQKPIHIQTDNEKTVQMRGNKDAIPMNLRVTEIFRREDNEWKLVHRHADLLASNS